MKRILTIVTAGNALPAEAINAATEALAGAGASVAASESLGEQAVDLPFDSPGLVDEDTLRQALEPWACDLAIQPPEGRKKRLLLADMDATIIAGESLDELAELAGIGTQVASITARAMNGELDFAEALRERLGLLAGQPASLIDDVVAGFNLNPGAAALVATMRAQGARCLLISGGLDVFVRPIAERLGFDGYRSNGLELEAGKLTGRPFGPILDKHVKLATLKSQAAEMGIALDQTAAVGDGANDGPMLAAAGLGVAFQGKPAAKAAAAHRIDAGDLTALLYFQGYREREFAAA